jgi:hypothetical protein
MDATFSQQFLSIRFLKAEISRSSTFSDIINFSKVLDAHENNTNMDLAVKLFAMGQAVYSYMSSIASRI